ncbi:MAG: hypothetical protein ACI39H_10275 [Lachnospiraceae bacterium]
MGFWTGIFMATTIVVYAITSLFFIQSHTSELSNKVIFRFDLDTDMRNGEVGPGDSFAVNPAIFNDATEEMYVFLKVQMPECADSLLYTFLADDEWTLVESGDGTVVYAYGNPDMTILNPGESTSALTRQMTMCSISNAEYASIDDINVTITGYAIGAEGVNSVPSEAWSACKQIGNFE